MRGLSLLCRLVMAWSDRYPVLEWLWRRLLVLWRCCRRMLVPLLGFSSGLLALRWRGGRGGEAEAGEEDRGPDRGPLRGSPQDVEAGLGEGQPEATGGKRAAGFDREVFSKRPKIDEDEFYDVLSSDTEENQDQQASCKLPRVEEDENEFYDVSSSDTEENQDQQDSCELRGVEEDEDEFDSEEYRVEMTDELYCGYDSTWETEEKQDSTSRRTSRGPGASTPYKFSRFESAARDMQTYRHNYPNQTRREHLRKKAPHDKPNLNFYLGLTPSLPDGVYITNFHEDWYGEYDTLEYVHTFIQWLFPLQEQGMNYEASALTEEEIEGFRKSVAAKENLLTSYRLMLDFYGIELCDENTGKVKRARNYRDRFRNLDRHTHNNLRITRILKCLGTLGYPHYQAPLVRFFLEETLVNGELPNVKDSVLNYFVFAVLDKRQRRDLIKFAYMNYDRKDEFVWCPKKIQMVWSGLSEPQMKDEDARDLSPTLDYFSLESETQDKGEEAAKADSVYYDI